MGFFGIHFTVTISSGSATSTVTHQTEFSCDWAEWTRQSNVERQLSAWRFGWMRRFMFSEETNTTQILKCQQRLKPVALCSQSINQSINQSVGQSVGQSIGQLANQSINQSINQKSIGQSINRSISQSVNRSVGQSINQSIGQLAGWSTGWLVNRSVGQSINQSVNLSVGQSVDWPINQSINQSIYQRISQPEKLTMSQPIKTQIFDPDFCHLTLPAGQMPAVGRHPALRPQHGPSAHPRQTSRSIEPLWSYGKPHQETSITNGRKSCNWMQHMPQIVKKIRFSLNAALWPLWTMQSWMVKVLQYTGSTAVNHRLSVKHWRTQIFSENITNITTRSNELVGSE